MAEIAEAAGISAPTLFRYFPSKASVLWFGTDESSQVFRQALRNRPASEPLVDAVFSAYLDMLHASSVRLPFVKTRIAIVTSESNIDEAVWPRYVEMGGIVADFAAQRLGESPKSLKTSVVAGMIWSALWAAITSWAAGDDPDPTTAVETARTLMTLPQ